MSSPHIYGITVTGSERLQLLRLVERHGTPAQREHLGGLVAHAPDMGSIAALVATVETPGRMAGVRGTGSVAAGGFSEATATTE